MTSTPPRFEDRFSAQATGYARHRPTYPAGLFVHLASLAPDRGLAWDCGAGTGQAAHALREHFEEVVGTDASEAQIRQARPAPGVTFRTAPAEASGLPDASVSLITVASALHWFDLPAFYAEARRVLKPGGALAAFAYGETIVSPEVDAIVDHLQNVTLGALWSDRIRYVRERYRTIPFPFEDVASASPGFEVSAVWTAGDMVGYLNTWSASRAYFEANGRGPTDDLEARLAAAWGAGARTVRWPLFMKAGYPNGRRAAGA